MSEIAQSRRALVALLAVLFVIWFGTLEYRKLIKTDEGRYAEISREMAATGDWVTPRLNGIKYFEKPPMQYWATALAFKAFGLDEWTARFWTGLTGFLGILLIYFTARRLSGLRIALLSAAVLASSLYWVLLGHINSLDMGLAFFLLAAVCAFLVAQQKESDTARTRRWMLVVWAAMAGAMLSKGLVGIVLPGATLFLYCLATGQWGRLKHLNWLWGPVVFFAIAAPWFVLVSLRNPEFPAFFFIHEHFARFATTVHHRMGAFWYFIPLLLLGMLPWTTFLPGALWRPFKDWWADRRNPAFRPDLLAAIWSVFVFVFFSASSSKLPSYILPIFPALALLIPHHVVALPPKRLRLHFLVGVVIAALGMAFLTRVSNYATDLVTLPMFERYENWLMTAALICGVGSVVAARYAHRGRVVPAVLVFAFAGLIAAQGVLLGHERLGRIVSTKHIGMALRPQLKPDTVFYSVGTYEHTLPFYLNRTLVLVEYQDEMAFGIQQEPDKWVPTLAEFKRRWLADRSAYAFTSPGYFEKIKALGIPYEIAYRDPERIIIRKP